MEAIIFLHGFTETKSMWQIVKDMQLDDVECYYEDVNSYFVEPISLEKVAEKILDKYSEKPNLKVIGHSMGGYIACQMLKWNSANLQGISLMNSTPSADSDDKKANRTKSVDFISKNGLSKYLTGLIPKLYLKDTDTLKIEKHIMEAEAIAPEIIQNQLAAMCDREDLSILFRESNILKQWIVGELDPLIDAKKILEIIPNFKEIILNLDTNSGHMSYVENTAFVQNAVTEFVDLKR